MKNIKKIAICLLLISALALTPMGVTKSVYATGPQSGSTAPPPPPPPPPPPNWLVQLILILMGAV